MYGRFFVMFAMIGTGFLLRKIHFIGAEMNNSLNKFIVYCAYPCLLTYNIGTMKLDGAIFRDFVLMFLISCGVFTAVAIYTRIYTKVRKFPPKASNVAEMAMACPNNGFMGFPLALAFLGSQGLFLMTAQNSAMNVFFFTYVLYALRRNNEERNKMTLKVAASSTVKVLVNPNILGVFLGFFFCITDIPLDNALGIYLSSIGGAATPMAMVFIGSTLAGNNFFEMLKNHIVWEAAINKLLIIPVILSAIVWLLPIGTSLKIILVLGFCFPTAATVPMLAEQEHQNYDLASKILFFSTVVSMATVPITITIIKMLFM